MRNALNKLADTVSDPAEKKVSNNSHNPRSNCTLWLYDMSNRFKAVYRSRYSPN